MIVSDAGPLIAFGRIKKLSILYDTLGTLMVPTRVLQECLVDLSKLGAKEIKHAVEIQQINPIQNNLSDDLLVYSDILGEGELYAISLAIQLSSGLLIDEKLGRSVAQQLHIKIIGTAGVLLLAYQKMVIRSVPEILNELQLAGYFLSKQLISEILKQL